MPIFLKITSESYVNQHAEVIMKTAPHIGPHFEFCLYNYRGPKVDPFLSTCNAILFVVAVRLAKINKVLTDYDYNILYISNSAVTEKARSAPHNLHCVSKKCSHLLTLCNFVLTDSQNFCSAGKRMKFATNPIQHYPHHLRHVATLPQEIKNSNFCR